MVSLERVRAWAGAQAGVALVSEQPMRLSVSSGIGPIDAELTEESGFLVISSAGAIPQEARALLADAEVRASVDQYVSSVLVSRSGLEEASLTPGGESIRASVRVYEDGLNGHAFLLALNELRKLMEILTAGASGVADSMHAYQQARQESAAAEARVEEMSAEAQPSSRLPGPAAASATPMESPPAPAPKCRNCGATLTESARFCVNCGAPVSAPSQTQSPPAQPTCRSCGSQLTEGARFCMSCGTPVA